MVFVKRISAEPTVSTPAAVAMPPALDATRARRAVNGAFVLPPPPPSESRST